MPALEISPPRKSRFELSLVRIAAVSFKMFREPRPEDRTMAIARERGLSVMPVLFDDCAFDAGRDPYLGKQDDPMPGTSNVRWVPNRLSACK